MKGLYKAVRNMAIGAAALASVVCGYGNNAVAGKKDFGFEIYINKMIYRAGEDVKIYITARDGCNYVYIFNKDGKGKVWRLYPNSYVPRVSLKKGEMKELPNEEEPYTINISPYPDIPTPQQEEFVGVCADGEISNIEKFEELWGDEDPNKKETSFEKSLEETVKKSGVNYDIESIKYVIR